MLHTSTRKERHAGYTLIELLLYMAIVSVLLSSVVTFFGVTVDARVKNETINEVNEQGAGAMDYITQTIRNATSITTPAAGANSASLTLVVPTGSLSPTVFDANTTVLGFNQDGGTTDSSDSNFMNATKFIASASGTVSTLYALVGATIGSSPNNQAQMAIYSGTSAPSTLLASSASVTLTANSWNAFPISTVSVASGQTYWLAYNTNGTATTQNDLRRQTTGTNQSMFLAQTFSTWPASWSGSADAIQASLYAPITTGSSTALRVTEGVGSPVLLTGSRLQVSGLTFKNLTRSGTAGVVQVSFTLGHLNPAGKNEYDYQKTFASSAEVGW